MPMNTADGCEILHQLVTIGNIIQHCKIMGFENRILPI